MQKLTRHKIRRHPTDGYFAFIFSSFTDATSYKKKLSPGNIWKIDWIHSILKTSFSFTARKGKSKRPCLFSALSPPLMSFPRHSKRDLHNTTETETLMWVTPWRRRLSVPEDMLCPKAKFWPQIHLSLTCSTRQKQAFIIQRWWQFLV